MNTSQWKEARLSAVEGLQLSDRAYNLIIGAVVLWGLGLNWVMARFFAVPILSMSYIAVIILYFVGSFGGMFIVYRSDVPAVSFLGFTLMALAMGLLLTHYLQYFRYETVMQAIRVTAITTGIMLVLAAAWPAFFLSVGRSLGVALLACVAIELIFRLIFRFQMEWIDWAVALIFCGYIGFDWARAQRYPKTLDNAIDSAADIYVDIINLFIRLLRIMGRKDSK